MDSRVHVISQVTYQQCSTLSKSTGKN